MTDAQLKNAAWYVVIALAGAILTTGAQLGVMLAGSDDILIRPLAATFVTTLFGALMTTAGASFRPRIDRSDLNKLVTTVGPQQARAALEVEATRQITGKADAITADQLAEIAGALVMPLADDLHMDVVNELERRMKLSPSAALDDERPAAR